ncbi:MAG: hypothetical protein L0H59_06825 [Tomitella sp.]|nr:hypothetical protein [Tomitella sp.]
MRTFRTSVLAGAGAVALASALALPGISSAAASVDPSRVTFEATNNGDCTATFTVKNTTNSSINKVVYWTGTDAPKNAPPFGDDRGATIAIVADPALLDADGNEHPAPPFTRGLEPVETTANVDLSAVANGADTVDVAYRMTGMESDDYDNNLKTVEVTGCSTPVMGSIGSLDIFGSLEGLLPE